MLTTEAEQRHKDLIRESAPKMVGPTIEQVFAGLWNREGRQAIAVKTVTIPADAASGRTKPYMVCRAGVRVNADFAEQMGIEIR